MTRRVHTNIPETGQLSPPHRADRMPEQTWKASRQMCRSMCLPMTPVAEWRGVRYDSIQGIALCITVP